MNEIDLLPLELKTKSLSVREIILPYEEAIKAIIFFEKCNWIVSDLIGWIKYADYNNYNLAKYQINSFNDNSEKWFALVQKTAKDWIKIINKAHLEWANMEEFSESELYFLIKAQPIPTLTDDVKDSKKEGPYFNFGATLRIFGKRIPNLEDITQTLGLTPTHTHRNGESRNTIQPDRLWENDMWSYDSPVDDEKNLNVHIQTLWDILKPHKNYLLKLKENYKVDVYMGYLSNSATSGFVVAPESLEMFVELNIPFDVSVIVV